MSNAWNKVWKAEIILAQKANIDGCVKNMEGDREDLLTALNAYSVLMNDKIQRDAKSTVNSIQMIISEMQDEIRKKADPVEQAARIQLEIEKETK